VKPFVNSIGELDIVGFFKGDILERFNTNVALANHIRDKIPPSTKFTYLHLMWVTPNSSLEFITITPSSVSPYHKVQIPP